MRPWGLSKSAPLTESPVMPEIVAAYRRGDAAQTLYGGRAVDWILAGGVALVTVVGLLLHPFPQAGETRRLARGDAGIPEFAVVAVPTLSAVSELRVSAPPLIEPQPVAAAMPSRSKSARAAATAEGNTARRTPALSFPATGSTPPREPVVIEDGQHAEAPPVPAAVPGPVDSWQPLRDALAACSRSSGLWERATCEQRARLAHCDGYWGNFLLCPSGRTEYTR